MQDEEAAMYQELMKYQFAQSATTANQDVLERIVAIGSILNIYNIETQDFFELVSKSNLDDRDINALIGWLDYADFCISLAEKYSKNEKLKAEILDLGRFAFRKALNIATTRRSRRGWLVEKVIEGLRSVIFQTRKPEKGMFKWGG